ncbi:DUF3019 domain-containing protein [Pseudoalteromonas xiamenensis]|uniref:DUF3019 domain-containing protein n=1 Tax=Pseudoalteromonas xiamenensis TaxID=882626 RepID=UPI0027E48222|nr:DUF3019 domain-containing protein [Pseudoalteromonas xiamenensis]WMN59625.1 DUF3019 domain-containing protein [Pseudoalteromonas xiamenensis]
MRFSWAVCALLVSLKTSANSTQIESTTTSKFILPGTCIAKKQATFCEMDVKISWQFDRKGQYCLLQKGQTLRCWNDAVRLQDSLTLRIENEDEFYIASKEGVIISTQTVKVVWATSSRLRRRLKSEWSIF